ncbi:MAG: AmmeMemoRadiSam system radical SAM enzyme [Candidatus Omnitrophica bacterium]|nr:AmmeMemoRadiSam system radical SAM enzyme [Candidatus Omnitrophota bacterium]
MKEALLYEKLENKTVHCFLCAHQCRIAENKYGFCGVRQNLEGALYTHVYGKIVASHVDPVEKKPLYHFLPGSASFSIACIGCNFRCGFCQNWQISQKTALDTMGQEGEDTPPERVVAAALKSGCESISYTYTEPTIFFEYAKDTAKLAKEKGLYNIFVTNGFMTADCLRMIRPYLDAANVDLKSFRDESYRKVCAGRLAPVLDSIKLMRELGIWVEVTTLVVPGFNDSKEELRDIAEFLCSVDNNIPWHLSRFHPDYKFTDRSSTPEKTLKTAQEAGEKCGLKYIYVGNVYGWGNDTYCHNCKKLLVRREVFDILEDHIENGKCAYCRAAVPGFFKGEKNA